MVLTPLYTITTKTLCRLLLREVQRANIVHVREDDEVRRQRDRADSLPPERADPTHRRGAPPVRAQGLRAGQ